MNRPPKIHLVSKSGKKAACGIQHVYPGINLAELGTADRVAVTCARCAKVIEQAADAGRMVFREGE